MIMTREGRAALKYQDEPEIPKILISSAHQPPVIIDGRHAKMGAWDPKLFVNDSLRRRLQSILGRLDVGNGTPVVDAVSDALAVDLRLKGDADGLRTLLALSDEAIIDLASDISWALDSEAKVAEFELPLGAKVVSQTRGGIRIDEEGWVLDADRPGLHPVETVDRAAGGRNLDLLHQEIAKRTRKLACRRLGLPTAHAIASDILRHELRFPPNEAFAGAMLQRSAFESGADRFRSALPDQIAAFAAAIVEDMRRAWKDRAAIAARVEDVRRVAIEQGHPIHAVAFAMGPADLPGPVSLYTEFRTLDDALRPGLVLEYVPGGRYEEEPRVRTPHEDWSLAQRDKLAALGADGRIDDLARGVISGAPEGSEAVLARLATDIETLVVIPMQNRSLYATLFWKDGEITAEITVPGVLEVFNGTIEATGVQIPETVAIGCAGVRLDRLIELPFTCDATVDEVQNNGTFARIKFTSGSQLVNTKSGLIWPEPKK